MGKLESKVVSKNQGNPKTIIDYPYTRRIYHYLTVPCNQVPKEERMTVSDEYVETHGFRPCRFCYPGWRRGPRP